MRFLILVALAMISTSAMAQTPPTLDNAVALQLGQCQLTIAKANTVVQALNQKIDDLTKKCGKPCEDAPKPAGPQPNAGTPDKSVR